MRYISTSGAHYAMLYWYLTDWCCSRWLCCGRAGWYQEWLEDGVQEAAVPWRGPQVTSYNSKTIPKYSKLCCTQVPLSQVILSPGQRAGLVSAGTLEIRRGGGTTSLCQSVFVLESRELSICSASSQVSHVECNVISQQRDSKHYIDSLSVTELFTIFWRTF